MTYLVAIQRGKAMRYSVFFIVLAGSVAATAQTMSVVTVNGHRYQVTCYQPNNCAATSLDTQVIYLPRRKTSMEALADLLQGIQDRRDREQAARIAAEQLRLLQNQNALLEQQLRTSPPAAPSLPPTPQAVAASSFDSPKALAPFGPPDVIVPPPAAPPAPAVPIVRIPLQQPDIVGCKAMGEVWAEYPFVRDSKAAESRVTAELMESIVNEAKRRGASHIRQKLAVSKYTSLRVSAWAYKCD